MTPDELLEILFTVQEALEKTTMIVIVIAIAVYGVQWIAKAEVKAALAGLE